MCKLYKNRCQKCQISQVGPLHPPDDQSGGWEAQGGPLHPPDFDRGLAPPPWTPLETASAELPIDIVGQTELPTNQVGQTELPTNQVGQIEL